MNQNPPTDEELGQIEARDAIEQVEQVFAAELNDDRALILLDALIVLRSKLPCTCSRSQGLHERNCRRYVPGHDLLSPVRRLARAREELVTSNEARRSEPKKDVDTLPAWLYWRFTGPDAPTWSVLTDDDRAYWEHQARAVRRAFARGGFKAATPAPVVSGGEQ